MIAVPLVDPPKVASVSVPVSNPGSMGENITDTVQLAAGAKPAVQ
jgi:hypothetical protein